LTGIELTREMHIRNRHANGGRVVLRLGTTRRKPLRFGYQL
jgi:hypothetical protein